jgi:DnaJ homolog subfamily B member 13
VEKSEEDGRDHYGSLLGDAFGGKNQPLLPAPADIEVTLECTLPELYNGCIKQASYSRNLLLHDGKTTRAQREEISVEVKPGYSSETVLTYKSKGHETEGHKPSNLVIKIAENHDNQYRRKGDDLIYTHTLTLE